jgi:hypothetical protein
MTIQNLKRYKVTPIICDISGSGVAGLELRISLVKVVDKIAYKYPGVRVAYQDDVASNKFKIWVYNGEEPVGYVYVDKHSLDVSSELFKHEADLDVLAYTFIGEIRWLLRLLTTSVVSDAGEGC